MEREDIKQKIMIAKFMNYDLNVMHDLDFDSSWNYLMPVVKKIYKTDTENIDWSGFNLKSNIKGRFIGSDIDIEKVYQSVVEFIEWYYIYVKL